MTVSFSGIYDVRFPLGTKSEEIDRKCDEANHFIKENLKLSQSMIDIKTMDRFDITKSDKKLTDKGIRVSTTIDNPWILCSLFDSIDKKLGQDYVNTSKVELILDTQA